MGQAGGDEGRSLVTSLYRVRTTIAGQSGAGQLATHYFDASGGGTAQDAATAVRTFWDTLKAMISPSYTFQVDNAVELIDSTTGQPTGLVSTTNTLVTGTGGGNQIPPASQGLIQWRTGFFQHGREVRGRTFIPGLIAASQTSSGAPSATLITAANSAVGAIISPASSDFMIYSRKNRICLSVLQGSLWGKFAVLRSRRD